MTQSIIQSLTQDAIAALIPALIALIGLAAKRLHISNQTAAILHDTAFQQNLERHAMDVALQVEEHYASVLKADPHAVVNAQNKADMFAAELIERVPGITKDQAMNVAQATLPKVGLGAAAVADSFLKAAARTQPAAPAAAV